MPNHVPPPKSPCAHKAYELTCAEYDELVVLADEQCQICGVGPAETKQGFLVVDHDAMVGRWAVRGLLCNDCNSALPAGTSPSWARRYLANPWWKRVGRADVMQARADQAAEAQALLDDVARASAEFVAARELLEKTLLEALRAPGARPSRIAAVSPWTAAHVRKLARDNGIEPDERYRERTEKARAKLLAEAAEAPPAE